MKGYRFIIEISFFLIIGLLCSVTTATAQFYPAVKYTKRDGIPSNSIYDITQDHQKVMWFATSKGITSYDGQMWRLQPDSLALPSSENTLMKLTDDGRIWAAGRNKTNFVIAYLHEGVWKKIEVPPTLFVHVGAFAFEVESGSDGFKIWVSIPGVIFEYDESTNKWADVKVDFFVNSLTSFRDGVYICSGDGLKTYTNGQIRDLKLSSLLPEKDIFAMAFDQEGYYLLGMDWLVRIRNEEVVEQYENIGILRKPLHNKYNLVVDARGRVFFSCDSPLQLLDKSTGLGDIIEIDNRIRYAKCNRAFVDIENNIWVGDHRGLFRFNLLRFVNYNHESGLSDQEVSAIFQQSDGTVLVANPTVINKIDRTGNVFENIAIPITGEIDARILDIEEDDEGNIFLAVGVAGLWRMEGSKVHHVKDAVNQAKWISSVEKWNGSIYVSSNFGIFEVQGDQFIKRQEIRGSRNLSVLDNERMTVATPRGIFIVYKSQPFELKSSELRELNNSYDITIWNNQMLIATQGGLSRVFDHRIDAAGYFDGDDPMYSLLPDGDDLLWMGTNDGILKWDGINLKHYNITNGLIGNEVNRNALIIDDQRKLWIGTESGASVYIENEDLTLNLKPRLSFTQLQDGAENYLQPEIENEISYDGRSVSIGFIGISFLDEELISYRYKLGGLDDDWIYLNNNENTTVRYTNLPHGNYRFQVQSRIEQGDWGEPISTTFRVLKPFYYQIWFYTLMVLLVVTLFYFYYRIRVKMLLKNQLRLKNLVTDRTREISSLNENLEQKVMQRTQELKDRNDRLSDYAYMNAHLLRAPLARIQSLAYLIESSDDKKLDTKLMQILKDSLGELDEVIFNINHVLKEEEMSD